VDNPKNSVGKTNLVVVIPAYKVSRHILPLIELIGPEVSRIIVVDDACPENSGSIVQQYCSDPRVEVLRHKVNLGVGGATKTGIRAAIVSGANIIIKVDGDGQMDPSLIPNFIEPITSRKADYVKGNRFFSIEHINTMPRTRIFGNLILSFYSKLSSGYWNVLDPNNGYIAINSVAARNLPLDKISNRYFFESDMLFRLNLLRAKIVDMPMKSKYGSEKSNLKIIPTIFEFSFKHFQNFVKRIVYTYFIRDLNLASLQLLFGLSLSTFGMTIGARGWWNAYTIGENTNTGTLILTAMSILSGLQLILGFFSYDISNVPKETVSRELSNIVIEE
jgi:glycosyltransferase involved in cell wall biosynthesis